MKLNSIRWRLVLSYVLITVITVGLVGLLSLTFLDRYVQSQTQTQLRDNARTVAQQADSLMTPLPRLSELKDLARSMAFLGHVRVRIFDARYNLVVDSGRPEDLTSAALLLQSDSGEGNRMQFLVPLLPRERALANQDKNPTLFLRIEESPWGRHIYYEVIVSQESEATPQPQEGQMSETAQMITARYPIGSIDNPIGFVQLDSSRSAGSQVLSAMRRALALAGLGAGLIAVLAGLLVGRGLTAPIVALEKSANRMSSGDLTARAPENGAGEIGQLSRQFNLMAGRLQTSFAALSAERDALRRFIADASHELRTPITALGNFLELLQGPAANDAAARAEFLRESQAQVKRMEWITANLLNLSRLDAGLVELDRQPVSLTALLHSAAASFLTKAEEKGISLAIDSATPEALLLCDRSRMEIVISNLLDNALKFTPTGGQVRLSGAVNEGAAQISVEDSGSGISSSDLPHIFQRFYRGKTTQDGSGLGLAIVESIVQAHGGQVQVESQPGRGSRFTLTLPT